MYKRKPTPHMYIVQKPTDGYVIDVYGRSILDSRYRTLACMNLIENYKGSLIDIVWLRGAEYGKIRW